MRDRHVTISESLNEFNTLTLKLIFWKTKTFFKKLEYRLLVESTKIENVLFRYKTTISEANALFRYKTTISEANVKTKRMMRAK